MSFKRIEYHTAFCKSLYWSYTQSITQTYSPQYASLKYISEHVQHYKNKVFCHIVEVQYLKNKVFCHIVGVQ